MNEAVLVVVEIEEIFDADALASYQTAARQQLLERGGVLVARGDRVVEGTEAVKQMLIQRWPSEASFLEWQASDAYRPLLEQRRKCVKLRIIILPSV